MPPGYAVTRQASLDTSILWTPNQGTTIGDYRGRNRQFSEHLLRSPRPRPRSQPSDIIDAEEHGIAHPSVDGGLAPASAASADMHLPRERAVLDLPVERGPAQAGSIEHGFDPQNSVNAVRHLKTSLHFERSFALW